MYTVSDQYKQAIKSTLKKGNVFGVLNINGTEYPLNDSNIVKDSLYITNQIVNDSKLCFGAVYAGELGIIINSNIDRYSLYGAKINLSYSLQLDEEGTVEVVPLGEFFVDTPQRIGSTIKLTAVDAMSNFDKPLTADINGELYDLLKFACDTCGVEMAQTREEILDLHSNATGRTYTLMQSQVATYRDALAFLSMVICSNATIDRFGKLKLVQYATRACDYTDKSSRVTNCKFNDYTTRYSCITARFLAEENYAPYSAKDDNISGLTLNLGDVPIVGGTPAEKYKVLNAMLDTLKQIVYVPTTLYIASNPAYDLGDMIECRDINNTTDSINMYVMYYSFEYRNKETINCYGENPLLQNIKSNSEKLTSSFENQISAKTMVIVNYINSADYEIRQELVDIITLSYVFDLDCRPIVLCTIPFTIDVDGYVEFALYDGLVPITDVVYRGYYEAGEHFASFMYLDNYTKGSRRNLKVLAKTYADTTSKIRVHDAQIRALQKILNPDDEISTDIDATEPIVRITRGSIKSIAYTNSGGGVISWDGELEFTDKFENVIVNSPAIAQFIADVAIGRIEPTLSGIVEAFEGIKTQFVQFDGVPFRTWGEYCSKSWGSLSKTRWENL